MTPDLRSPLAARAALSLHIGRYGPGAGDARRSTAAAGFLKSLLVILLIALCGCSQKKGLPVRYIVPDGYKGIVHVTCEPATGSPVPITNGEYVVTLPADGKLTVRSLDFIKGHHVVFSQYASGAPLPSAPEKVDVYLIDVDRPHNPPRSASLLVGTHGEMDEAFKKITY